jgi:hypothetical protein
LLSSQLLHLFLEPLNPSLESKVALSDENTKESAGETEQGEQETLVAFQKNVTLVQACIQPLPSAG